MGMSAKEARIKVWEELKHYAKPDSRFNWKFSEFIADYEGSELSAKMLCAQDLYQRAETVFIAPDNNLSEVRKRAMADKKTILMANYGITRGFFIVRPDTVPKRQIDLAATLDGVQKFWKHITITRLKKEVKYIDLLVTGGSVVSLSGARLGKGSGYFDLEWGMLYEAGLVDKYSAVVMACHDCQVVGEDLETERHDVGVDYIATPTGIIPTRIEQEKPECGILWDQLKPGMLEQIPPLQELWCDQYCI